MLKEAVVLLALVCVALAAEALGPLEKKPKKFEGVEGCYISELDAVIPFGESRPSNTGCMKYFCGSPYVTYTSCGSVGTSPPCYVTRDPDQPYPACCPYVKCD